MLTMKDNSVSGPAFSRASNRVGFYSAIFMAVITVLTFGFAISAIPISGAYCLEGCIEYPYLDTIARFPKDYLWMYLAILLILSYVVLVNSIHSCASQDRRIFSQIGLSFAVMAASILLIDFYIQFSVIPVSLIHGETEGVALVTQYNPHGIFIVLEELGYLLMSLSFLFLALVFNASGRLEAAVRWVFILGFLLTFVSLAWISIQHGLDREYRFEIAVISIDWLVLLVNGILLAILFGGSRVLSRNR